MPKIACHTLGCKVNQYDTEAMREAFERAGYESASIDEPADVYLINTCTVTGTGDSKSLKLIRRVKRLHPESDVIAAGCLAQRDSARVLGAGALLAIGVQRRADVVRLYEQAKKARTPMDATAPLSGAGFEELNVSVCEGKTRATMKIQEGCDRYCAYCIIPFVRGPVRSMELSMVKREAERLAASGYIEIVLTGIHLASYGRDRGCALIDAIRAVNCADGVLRIRLGSLEPGIVTREFARELASLNKVCPQFHLSLQSGSAGVLKRMRRAYTPEDFARAAGILREEFPNCALTTDVIAGFPGETEAEALETLDFIQKLGFARIHVFPYSRRSGTLADMMPDQLPEAVKKRRAEKLIALGNQLEVSYVQSLKGTRQAVLFETELPDGEAEGYTAGYVRVRARAKAGELARVQVLDSRGALAIGRVVYGGE